MRTTVYVDGYNLYYGCLQGTPWKWLDLPGLIAAILAHESPGSKILQIHYFTAPVIARLASRGQASVEAQNAYLKALRAAGVAIHLGRHQLDVGFAPAFHEGIPPDRRDAVPIWHLTEKETDVRLALTLYRDTQRYAPEQVVLVSGDSDMVPVLEMLREDCNVQLGLILPRRVRTSRALPIRLSGLADWTRQTIHEKELADNQFPDRIPTHRKPARRPDFW